ncbi:L-2-hydroxyglutarate oxidase [soil metagenome]
MKIVIVGGGLVGLATAYVLTQMIEGAIPCVCEKEPTLGAHQSTHNSGVLHAGLYYAPGSLKALLAVRGIRLMTAFAQRHDIPHEICGKIVVATEQREVGRLRDLFERGIANRLRGLSWLEADEVREREPNVRSVAAVHVPEEGIIDYAGVVHAMRAAIEASGGRVMVNAPVLGARRDGGRWRVTAGSEELSADFVVNCAGLYSDRVARLFGARPSTRIVPFRGDYFTLARPGLVRHLVYPVPDPSFPFLGVHYTRMIGGGVECGPSAVLSLDREGYRPNSVRTRDAIDALTFPGLWRFIARYPRMTWGELRRAQSPRLFLESLQRLVPDVTLEDLQPGPTGVRAQAMRADGTLVQDFDFVAGEGVLHVLNAPSPGATASLAIGEEIARRVSTLHGSTLRADRLGLDVGV